MSLKTPPSRPQPWDEMIKSTRSAPPRRRFRVAKRALLFAVVAILIFAVLAMGLLAYVQLKLRDRGIDLEALSTQEPSQPMNVLVIGSDSRTELTPEEQVTFGHLQGRRADTIFLIHIDERRDQAVVIHFPRDLRVTYPTGQVGKINGLYDQGPGPLIDTVEAFTSLPVHHYVEVNFVGFRNIVNALGGVEVFFEQPMFDQDSGLNVPAGCVNLTGDQALAFVRVRKIDDDFGRIGRQQLFISELMRKVSSPGTVLNPAKIVRFVNLFTGNVTTDADLGLRHLTSLGWRLRSFDPKTVDMRVVPSSPRSISGISFVAPHDAEVQALFNAMRERQSLPDYGRTGVSEINPADVKLAVLNGTTVDGLATKAKDELESKKFNVEGDPANADRGDYQQTTVYFRPGFQQQAELVASSYGAAVAPMPASITVPTQLAFVAGIDFAEGRAQPPPAPPEQAPAPKPPIHRCDA
ncbi:MAG: LCP family protein [Actinomycetota bacterium]